MKIVYTLLLTGLLQITAFPSYADTNIIVKIPDFSIHRDVKKKKSVFFNFMRNIIKTENNRILVVRKRIITLKGKTVFTASEKSWLINIAKKYNVDVSNFKDKKFWGSLLARVDIIPLELAMAQSANESSWGTSRFARKGRNFFGQWCFKKGCGLVPSRRDKGARHEVAVFKSVNNSVAAYIHNLNTGRVYAGLRKIRQRLRAKNKQPEAIAMAAGLSKYSTRRMAYVKEIRAMIRYNRKLMLGS